MSSNEHLSNSTPSTSSSSSTLEWKTLSSSAAIRKGRLNRSNSKEKSATTSNDKSKLTNEALEQRRLRNKQRGKSSSLSHHQHQHQHQHQLQTNGIRSKSERSSSTSSISNDKQENPKSPIKDVDGVVEEQHKPPLIAEEKEKDVKQLFNFEAAPSTRGSYLDIKIKQGQDNGNRSEDKANDDNSNSGWGGGWGSLWNAATAVVSSVAEAANDVANDVAQAGSNVASTVAESAQGLAVEDVVGSAFDGLEQLGKKTMSIIVDEKDTEEGRQVRRAANKERQERMMSKSNKDVKKEINITFGSQFSSKESGVGGQQMYNELESLSSHISMSAQVMVNDFSRSERTEVDNDMEMVCRTFMEQKDKMDADQEYGGGNDKFSTCQERFDKMQIWEFVADFDDKYDAMFETEKQWVMDQVGFMFKIVQDHNSGSNSGDDDDDDVLIDDSANDNVDLSADQNLSLKQYSLLCKSIKKRYMVNLVQIVNDNTKVLLNIAEKLNLIEKEDPNDEYITIYGVDDVIACSNCLCDIVFVFKCYLSNLATLYAQELDTLRDDDVNMVADQKDQICEVLSECVQNIFVGAGDGSEILIDSYLLTLPYCRYMTTRLYKNQDFTF